MLRARTRLISLRITEEEYEAIRQASADGGARCVSEFARNALLGSAHAAAAPTPASEPQTCGLLRGFDQRLTRVEHELEKVAGEVQAHRGESAASRE
jgi:hypothetical protein